MIILAVLFMPNNITLNIIVNMFRLVVATLLLVGSLGNAQPTNKSGDGRIIGGDETTIEKFPYQVSLRHFSIAICGGTILDAYTVVTAAHCTYEKFVQYLSVRAGSTSNKDGGQIIQVDRVIPHEKYNRINQDYDVCILKLKEPLEFGPGVGPLALQDTDVDVEPGTEAVISGWGRTIEGDSHSSPELLRKVEVDIISMEECRIKYKNRLVTDRMLCATSNGKDSCQGDSGGPLFANNKLVGVVSWGQGCGNPKYAGVYSKISVLRPWIEQHLN